MRTTKLPAVLAALALGCAFGIASAKLPAPSEEQKAKAAEAKAKADEGSKRDAELLAKSQDRAAENYKRSKVVKTGGAAAPAVEK